MFAWNKTTSPQCSSIQYVISAIECGNCPNTTTDTNITCVHFSVSNHTCMFAVRTEICGYLVGPRSEYVIVNLFGKSNKHTSSYIYSYQYHMWSSQYRYFSFLMWIAGGGGGGGGGGKWAEVYS